MKKTILLLFLTLMSLCLARAQSGQCGEYAFWELNGNTLNITATATTTIDFGTYGLYGFYAPWNDYQSSITTVIVGDDITNIPAYSFMFSAVSSITIGSSVSTIGDNVFSLVFTLTSIILEATTPPSLGQWTFNGNDLSVCTLEVPYGTLNAYSASAWGALGFADITEAAPPAVVIYGQVCAGETYINVEYEIELTSGNYVNGANYLAGDTILMLTVHERTVVNWEDIFTASTTTYTGYGFTIPNPAEDTYTRPAGQDANGCDSIVSLTLTFAPAYTWLSGNGLNACECTFENGVFTIQPQQGKTACAMANYAVVYPSNVTSAPWINHSIETLVIMEGVQHIGDYAFYKLLDGITSLEIPNSVTSIGEAAFLHANMETLLIGDGVETIGAQAFQQKPNSVNLHTLTIGSSVTSIGNGAFANSTGLVTLNSKPALPPAISLTVFMTAGSFHEVSNTANVYVPCNSVGAYTSSDWGTVFSNIQGIAPEPATVYVKIREGETYTGYGLNVNTQGTYTGYATNNCNQVVHVTLTIIKFIQCQ